ncbi:MULTISPECIES: addiction module antidote protein [Pseudomonas]|jgi:probable addiction module antidote protein|uniref:addiction module antidote protein n=1 Tax=Pseudomonas TaxID=286 RepID=UPI000D1AB8BD|nr:MULTISPECIES: addiction module antidote protein [Pseudomonas]QKJ38162.1 putative addiction module antidote protein [Pseudomonas sp. MPDS]
MTEQLTRWDSAEYLKTEEDMANYLDACMEEAGDDPAFIAKPWEPLHELAELARDAGLSRENLYRALSGEGNPEFGTILKSCQSVGTETACQHLNRSA